MIRLKLEESGKINKEREGADHGREGKPGKYPESQEIKQVLNVREINHQLLGCLGRIKTEN